MVAHTEVTVANTDGVKSLIKDDLPIRIRRQLRGIEGSQVNVPIRNGDHRTPQRGGAGGGSYIEEVVGKAPADLGGPRSD
jgi:hypothetical protein